MNKERQYKEYDIDYNKYIYEKIPKNKKILDIGCNTGLLGEALKKNKQCEVWGADYSREAIKLAKKRLDKTIVCDFEKEIPFKKEKFDIIILADILEHLKNPEDLLLKIKKLLNSGGIILASIPNVANIYVRFNLLFGKWDYKNSGILDKTHLKFFTKKTMIKLFVESGYKINGIDSTPGFDFLILKHFKFLIALKEKLCKTHPKLFSTQFIISAKNNLKE